ncbi:spermidine synthase [Sulfurimicrobium lacus]|uniref:Spermidine synthase n=1 Tax=Sulfurimicrobium lacus TaxID=2715678 RepID=A0A6F8VCA9_9PROT|nr:transferase [Sulfurimicrobium lacus]BCB27304.1 spermidine synthase [Sulfurimicrobium lacus]
MSTWNDFWRDYQALPPSTGKPYLVESDCEIALHFDFWSIQSHMRKTDPDKLTVGYTRTMMGFLLFQPRPEQIAMVGLGGGSLAKYCLRHLPNTHFTAVEINPDVISLRDKFGIPPDGPHFKVLCDDGAIYVQDHSELVDVLIVDGFDQYGQAEQLCSREFYGNCHAKLRDGGVLVVNLLSNDTRSVAFAEKIRDSFDGQVVIVEAEESGNIIAFAYKGMDFPPLKATLKERVMYLSPTHTISFRPIAQKMIRRLDQHISWIHF